MDVMTGLSAGRTDHGLVALAISQFIVIHFEWRLEVETGTTKTF